MRCMSDGQSPHCPNHLHEDFDLGLLFARMPAARKASSGMDQRAYGYLSTPLYNANESGEGDKMTRILSPSGPRLHRHRRQATHSFGGGSVAALCGAPRRIPLLAMALVRIHCRQESLLPLTMPKSAPPSLIIPNRRQKCSRNSSPKTSPLTKLFPNYSSSLLTSLAHPDYAATRPLPPSRPASRRRFRLNILTLRQHA